MTNQVICILAVSCPAIVVDLYKVIRIPFAPTKDMEFRAAGIPDLKPRKIVYSIDKLQFEILFVISLKNEEIVEREVHNLVQYGWERMK